ncbi:hypothetical protein CCP2SC5_520021 [Azospirillaceae bacterium]
MRISSPSISKFAMPFSLSRPFFCRLVLGTVAGAGGSGAPKLIIKKVIYLPCLRSQYDLHMLRLFRALG